jgi:hypothetical protein
VSKNNLSLVVGLVLLLASTLFIRSGNYQA